MRAVSLFHGSRSERTFTIALALLAAVAAAQLLGALLLHARRAREARATQAPAEVAQTPGAISATLAPAHPTATAPPRAAITQSRRTKGGRLPTPSASVPDELLQVAKALRLHGDTANAIAKLQQASALAPQNVEVLAELAITYESMQLFDRSNEAWRKLQSLGAAAGPLAELAELKLRVGAPVQGNSGSTGRLPNEAAALNETSGISDGSTFGISQVTQTTVPDADALTHLTLRVGVKVRPNRAIDYTQVKIQVFFYDVVDNDQVLLTNAEVSYEWVTTGHNWADSDTEVLDVAYLRPKKHYPAPGAALAPVPDSVEKATRAQKGKGNPGEAEASDDAPRQYLGYIVRVYYKEELQAVRADPTRLLNLFPPPFTAPPQ